MALQLGALRDALMHPGDPALATAAAEEVAGYDLRLAAIDSRLSVLTALIGVVMTLQLAFGMGTLWFLLNISSRLPR